MTNKTTKQSQKATLQQSISEFQKILSTTGKLTRRSIFGLILIVASIGAIVFGIIFLIDYFKGTAQDPYMFLWVFVGVSLLVGLVVGTIVSIWFSKKVKNAIKPYFDALDRISKGDFSTGVTDENDLLKNTFVAEKFNQMVTSLRSVETLREGFISDFSHEFKTPIVSISGFAKLLKTADLTDEERNEYLDVIINESERLVHLSQSVLLLTRLDDHVVQKQAFLLDEQLRQTVLLFDKALKDKNIHVELCAEQIVVYSSQQLLSNVWINLLSNAIKFSVENSQINITAKHNGNNITVSVCDHGCGIDPESQQYIFNKFYQCDKSHSVEGNGLGLPIVQKVLKLVGGDISVQSELGKGSTFTVILPNDKN